ncbi:hypothetical protein AWC05_20580 [Mycobacterium florentinum]|uniref:Aminoglycoside phosphotransferase domain-containing protein n=1 Tax=Mycobacterium florentinum TaxID=292462 RepID=A0A1X1U8I8_MYCFL|nr:phosphotransferase family protein [Mycobacterium florentinum]MCV7410623.1 phosphotransferase family protein [Mycobacterium florentinum]ORV53140.1 hypothetical protein AWC05_20580 [Mycobacterium florentinum]BBX79947.1 aminoglycoside phosphotransferase [Mycobacterium florentinum]
MTTTVCGSVSRTYETELAGALKDYVRSRLGRSVEIAGLRKLSGGTSHETWAFDMHDTRASEVRHLVLRRDVEGGMLDGDLGTEFDLLTALTRSGFPVPRPWWCEAQASPLTTPFMIMERVDGTDIRKYLAAHPKTDRGWLGTELVTLQSRLHRLDCRQLPLPAGSHAGAVAELDKWTRAIDATDIDPGPLINAATSWLSRNLPHTPRLTLVHGDFKSNNLVFGVDGTVTVLDWELAHIGDPLEDIAWTLLWTTRFDLVGGLLTAADYQEAYEKATNVTVDPAALLFWRILALVKLAAIFLTGVSRGSATSPTLALMGRGVYRLEADLADLLELSLDEAQHR